MDAAGCRADDASDGDLTPGMSPMGVPTGSTSAVKATA